MTTLVTDAGFQTDDWTHSFTQLDQLAANDSGSAVAVDVPSDADPDDLANRLENINLVRVDFPNFADGRGFTIAKRLRLMGYTGRLRARGNVIADQYAMARRSGFDEVEIDQALAERQPEQQWLARANWHSHDYQSRVRG